MPCPTPTPRDKYGDPVFQVTPRMTEINDLMVPLEEELEALRRQWPNPYSFANEPRGKIEAKGKALHRIRELRKQLADLGNEFWGVSAEINADWHAQRPVWSKSLNGGSNGS